MNKKLIIMVIMVLSSMPLLADCYRGNDGRWYCYDRKTSSYKALFPTKNISDPTYWERKYPYQKKSDLTSFKTADRSYIDQTNRDMGNR